MGEVYLPAAEVTPYLEHLDLAFSFELFHAPWERERQQADAIAAAPERAAARRGCSRNHDFPRLATRFGEENARAAAELLLTLPGTAFVYQGEEIGMVDGPGATPPIDRAGRDGARHPMQWDASQAGSRAARRGCRWSIPSAATSPPSATTRSRCSTITAL